MQPRAEIALTRALAGLAAIWLASVPVSAQKLTAAQMVGQIVLHMPDKAFGGFSGFEISPDGRRFHAVTDHAHLLTGRLERDGKGRIRGIAPEGFVPLKDPKGRPIAKGRERDAEGLAVGKDGTILVSFEGASRIWAYCSPACRARWVPAYRRFIGLAGNAGLEALAIGPDGSLYTLAEAPDTRSGDHSVYRFRDGGWSVPFAIPGRGNFRPVGADFGPDGLLYILERYNIGALAFASRVRRFKVSDDKITDEAIILETPIGAHDNLEGLSVWRDSGGHIRLTMISDDNFSHQQRTEIVEFRLP